MPCIESKFDSRTLTPYSFSNALISFGSRYSDQLKYTRSPSGTALTTCSAAAGGASSWRPTPQPAKRQAEREPGTPLEQLTPAPLFLVILHSPHRQPQAVPPHRLRRYGGIAQRELDREPIHQRSQQERQVVGVALHELAARLSLLHDPRDRLAPAPVKALARRGQLRIAQ